MHRPCARFVAVQDSLFLSCNECSAQGMCRKSACVCDAIQGSTLGTTYLRQIRRCIRVLW